MLMVRTNIFKSLAILAVLTSVSSCGLDLNELYEADGYNSPVFNENYYRIYPDSINPDNANNSIQSEKTVLLDENQIATTYQEATNKMFDLDMPNLDYSTDSKDEKYIGVGYGPTKKMNSIDDIFKYGYISKLFDGQMFCNAKYELVRVQLDERGFGVMFDKEIVTYDYFAINFKVVVNDPNDQIPLHTPHLSSIKLNVHFYVKDNGKYNKISTSHVIENMLTNGIEMNSNMPSGPYVFYALNLKMMPELDLTRCCGFSVDYELINDEIFNQYPQQDLSYAVLLYEVLFPNSTWR